MAENKRLTTWKKLKFGVGDFGVSVMGALIQFYMLFYYTDVVHIDPGLAGTAMLVGKLTWDMVNDVLFGYLQDRYNTRWGKRRPYLIFCAVPMMLGFWLLLSLPEGLTGAKAFFAIIGTSMLFDTFHTLVVTAYSAMTAELTLDYDERTSLTTYRMVFSIIGYIGGAGASVPLSGFGHLMAQGVRDAVDTDGAMGILTGALTAAAAGIGAAIVFSLAAGLLSKPKEK